MPKRVFSCVEGAPDGKTTVRYGLSFQLRLTKSPTRLARVHDVGSLRTGRVNVTRG